MRRNSFYHLLYSLLKKIVSISFNILNLLLGGNLPPLVGVNVIVEENERYLVLEHSNGKFSFPGGFMRWRERPAQTALREVKEETGLSLHLKGSLTHYSITSRNFLQMSTITIVYIGELIGGELRSSIEGKPCWRDEAQLRKHSTSNERLIYLLDEYLRFRAQSAGKVPGGNEHDMSVMTGIPTLNSD